MPSPSRRKFSSLHLPGLFLLALLFTLFAPAARAQVPNFDINCGGSGNFACDPNTDGLATIYYNQPGYVSWEAPLSFFLTGHCDLALGERNGQNICRADTPGIAGGTRTIKGK